MNDFFKDYNPWGQGVFFLGIVAFTMFLRHPVVQVFSLLGALVYNWIQVGLGRSLKTFCMALGSGVFISILNPLLVHQGATILAYFPNGNPLTLESIFFGLSAGAMFTSTILWLSCHNRIMTSDRILYLSAGVFPSLSLILSMVLRFVPLYKERIKTIYACRLGIGEDLSQGNLWRRFKNALKIFSIFVTWSLEASIETADSMKARGHGLPGRTHFALFKMERRDWVLLGLLAFCASTCILAAYRRKFKLVIYPMVKIAKLTSFSIFAFGAFILFAFMPVFVSLLEEYRWKYSK
ncbi:Energy-coupling factor transporter transmembrane protein EcfT [Urinicoccus massiliensis]|uniref:Energy-coupling factor transporter transmembrane protein EcfT n=1 Tax=Urinicoccus massiliensis TaxID=1723382 RepID=A0A8H2M4E0_9FIRM|nr:energy-coupling factor transporter transmembrane component T [Urinicoccus massiliensis]VFB15698.1 Energy-coupling factor transporter transmembrane protein EcfT [Urinicoccus massiliensis]